MDLEKASSVSHMLSLYCIGDYKVMLLFFGVSVN